MAKLRFIGYYVTTINMEVGLDILYYIFVFPFESLLLTIFEFFLSLGISSGAAVILLSISVNLIMIPLYWYAEIMQRKERAIREIMSPKIKEYKEVFKGNELFLYTQNLYKQHNYHPIYAFRSLLGLIFQIPFFIGAYYLLSNTNLLDNQSFLFINDLSKPDYLLTLMEIKVNILPFIMFIVSVVSAVLYSSLASIKENISLYVISFLFLILLYESPAGLLVYWTVSNIFGAFKNHIFKIVFKNKNSLGTQNA